MSQSLNVIALISGGKDSLYSILHCIQNGHKVIALANLHPQPVRGDEANAVAGTPPDDTNSFMYQTVGHALIPLYAAALRLPLYRRPIAGSATQTGRSYDPSLTHAGHDETEDLMPLLRDVLAHHPHANALCTGAILSTYQRTRIESVAARLRLVPLAFLWQYPALPPPVSAGGGSRGESLTGLLDDMAGAGCVARIVKVASGGMGEDLVWTDVTGARTRRALVTGMAPFLEGREDWLRAAVLGEGGEYETLALAGPRSVWVGGRIEVEAVEVARGEGGVYWVRASGARVVQWVGEEEENDGKMSGGWLVCVPGMFDWQFEQVLEKAQVQVQVPQEAADGPPEAACKSETQFDLSALRSSHIFHPQASTLQISNLTAPEYASVEQQGEDILQKLRATLSTLNDATAADISINSTQIVSTTLLLRSIADFASVNSVYASLFPNGMPNPPARVAVACGECLPEGIEMSLSLTLDLGDRGDWRGLHVQGRSYWAPANIGAYGQAIAVGLRSGGKQGADVEVVHVAGQIPLVPATMELYQATLREQAILALQHLWRVGQERGVDAWTWGVAFLDQQNSERDALQHVETAWAVWKTAHEVGTRPKSKPEDDDDGNEEDDSAGGMDAWDLRHNRGARFGFDMSKVTVGEHLHLLPNQDVFVYEGKGAKQGKTPSNAPPLVVAEVKALPRGAPIEWHSLGLGALVAKYSGTRAGLTNKFFWRNWGVGSWMSIMPVVEHEDGEEVDDSEDENERERKEKPQTISAKKGRVVFLTLLVYKNREPISNSEGTKAIPTISELLYAIEGQGRGSSSCTQAHLEGQGSTSTNTSTIHSTAYVASCGISVWEVLTADQPLPGATVIPCRRLWGAVDAAGEAIEVVTSSSEGPGHDGQRIAEPRELSVAITMRWDIE